MKIVIVCTGNTCRSPIAEALIKKKFPDEDVISRGLYVALPSGPSKNACEIMNEKGLDIRAHISCQLDEKDVEEADVLLTMTKSQKEKIIRVIPEAKGKVYTLCEYVGIEGDITDPFGGNLEAYRKCAAIIEKCVEEMKI